MQRSHWQNIIFSLVLAAAIAAIYAPALRAPFIFDDRVSVEENSSIERLFPLVADLPRGGPLNPPRDLPTSGRPLVNLSLAVNYCIGGRDPAGYHAFNIA